ncbi:MAG TPA: hypothetical protein DDW78_00065 [Treponema sp.]|nr:hypothetical protein [Treponema sp.]
MHGEQEEDDPERHQHDGGEQVHRPDAPCLVQPRREQGKTAAYHYCRPQFLQTIADYPRIGKQESPPHKHKDYTKKEQAAAGGKGNPHIEEEHPGKKDEHRAKHKDPRRVVGIVHHEEQPGQYQD